MIRYKCTRYTKECDKRSCYWTSQENIMKWFDMGGKTQGICGDKKVELVPILFTDYMKGAIKKC